MYIRAAKRACAVSGETENNTGRTEDARAARSYEMVCGLVVANGTDLRLEILYTLLDGLNGLFGVPDFLSQALESLLFDLLR